MILGMGHSAQKLIDQVRLHDQHDPHRTNSRLSEVILGGQDGLVNVLGVILGVAAAIALAPWPRVVKN